MSNDGDDQLAAVTQTGFVEVDRVRLAWARSGRSSRARPSQLLRTDQRWIDNQPVDANPRLLRPGLLLAAAGAAFVAEGVVFLTNGRPDQPGTVQDVVALVASALLAIALLALLPLHRERGGRGGRLAATGGIVTAVAGLLIQMVALVAALSGQDDVWRGIVFAIGFFVMAVGLLVYGVAVQRLRVLPRWAAAPFFLPLPLLFVSGDYAVIVFGAVWIVLGAALAARPRVQPRCSRPDVIAWTISTRYSAMVVERVALRTWRRAT